MSAHPPARPGAPPAEPRRAAPHRYRFLLATADADARVGVKALLEGHGCEVLAAAGGVDCLGLLRAIEPDVLVLIAPLLWGSAEGVLEVLHADPALHRVTALVFADPGDDRLPPVAFHFFPGPAPYPAPLERLTGRVSQWLWYHRTAGRPARARGGLSLSPG